MLNTAEESFEYVDVISAALSGPADQDQRDTFIVVGSDRRLALDKLVMNGCDCYVLKPDQLALLRTRSRGLVLTDDYAPVDNLLVPVIRDADR
jgi:hypothetical protein